MIVANIKSIYWEYCVKISRRSDLADSLQLLPVIWVWKSERSNLSDTPFSVIDRKQTNQNRPFQFSWKHFAMLVDCLDVIGVFSDWFEFIQWLVKHSKILLTQIIYEMENKVSNHEKHVSRISTFSVILKSNNTDNTAMSMF